VENTVVEGWCEEGMHFVQRSFKDYILHGICAEHPDKVSTADQRRRKIDDLSRLQALLPFKDSHGTTNNAI
jgi:hypothetical protein